MIKIALHCIGTNAMLIQNKFMDFQNLHTLIQYFFFILITLFSNHQIT